MSDTERPRRASTGAGPAPELIDAGFALEIADAPLLHRGLGLADIAHVLDLRAHDLLPEESARRLLALLVQTLETPAEDFPYDPAHGEVYNSRERYFVSRLGEAAGWLHAGRPRREAVRVALRLHLRSALVDLIEGGADLAGALARLAGAHTQTWMADQTYLQHAQPSTFGHYALSFAYPVLRDGRRLLDALAWTNASPSGAGCVNGTRLLEDRDLAAELLGFAEVIEHTRDAMWQADGLIDMVAVSASLVTTQSKLAEDLEIWASSEFDYVTIADAYSRASVLMPQKRNPYALSIVRGAAGTLIGRVSGVLAVTKTPSARSDNMIFSYGEVPRAVDLAVRTTRLTAGVIRTLQVNAGRMWEVLEGGFAQATDLAEHVMQVCEIDYRSAYHVVGRAVRAANRRGLRGVDLDNATLDAAAQEVVGRPLGLSDRDLAEVLDPRRVVLTRTARGGAAPAEVARMATERAVDAQDLRATAQQWRSRFRQAEDDLVGIARRLADTEPGIRSGSPGGTP
ncbi:MAG: argininosuccinate lyase [Streptosporangiaceae bacterium]